MILVTGGSGFMGSRLVKKLVADGHQVKAMVIANDPLLKNLEGVNCQTVIGDITNPESLKPLMQGVKTVFHLAAVMVSNNKDLFRKINLDGTKNVVDAAVEAGVEHFVYISAAAANYATRTTYGDTKIEAEKFMVKTNQTNFTIIRPTLLYGPDGGQEFVLYFKALNKFPLIAPVVGLGQSRKRLVWVEDIITGLSQLVNKPIAYGKLYNFSGGSDYSMWETTKKVLAWLNINKPMIPIPVFLCYFFAWILSLTSKKPLLKRDTILGVTMDANFSFDDAKRDIGYSPVTLEEGLQRSFPDHKASFLNQ
ncbi:TPA: hypothetical protein DF272_03360 [Candidatus Falkowbacteria bacterium]|nr:hypothetical protein [Candidatus Falkowbacteria bacterium]